MIVYVDLSFMFYVVLKIGSISTYFVGADC